MRSRTLAFRASAFRDLQRQQTRLARARGVEFAEAWTNGLVAWLERLASSGAQYGTAHPRRAGFRTFGYRRQATILAEFREDIMVVVRVHLPGEDWQA